MIAEDGEVKGVKEALEKLAKEKAYLLKQKSRGGIGTPRSQERGTAPGEKDQPALGPTVRL